MKRKWTLAEEAALQAAWSKETPEAIATQLGRTVIAVQERGRLLGLHIRRRRYGARIRALDTTGT